MGVKLKGMECCGISEVYALGAALRETTVEQVVKDLAEVTVIHRSNLEVTKKLMAAKRAYYSGCFLLFSGHKDTHCDALAAFIKQHNLGEVMEGMERKNPNSGNLIKVYIWAYDSDAWKAWYYKFTGLPVPALPPVPVPTCTCEQCMADYDARVKQAAAQAGGTTLGG